MSETIVQAILTLLAGGIGGGGIVKLVDKFLSHRKGDRDQIIKELWRVIRKGEKELISNHRKYEKEIERLKREHKAEMAEVCNEVSELEDALEEGRKHMEKHVEDSIKQRIEITKLKALVRQWQPNLLPDSDNPSPANDDSESW